MILSCELVWHLWNADEFFLCCSPWPCFCPDFKAKGMDDAEVKKMITKDNFEKYKKNSRENTVRALTISFVIGEIAKKEVRPAISSSALAVAHALCDARV